uniref:Uncharacterized protein n=1 Tax=Anguilla anguilla TaxID=7936 RepID=A0A0E9P8I5_ANGAN
MKLPPLTSHLFRRGSACLFSLS